MIENIRNQMTLIAAVDENRVIGRGNDLIWRLPADLKFFRAKTMGHTVIMGRRTFDSMGKPLKGRRNIVLTTSQEFKAEGCEIAHSLEEAFDLAGSKPFFVIGGAKVYEECLPFAGKMILTHLQHTFEGDAYFPQWNPTEWIVESDIPGETDLKNPYSYTFREYRRAAVR